MYVMYLRADGVFDVFEYPSFMAQFYLVAIEVPRRAQRTVGRIPGIPLTLARLSRFFPVRRRKPQPFRIVSPFGRVRWVTSGYHTPVAIRIGKRYYTNRRPKGLPKYNWRVFHFSAIIIITPTFYIFRLTGGKWNGNSLIDMNCPLWLMRNII